MSRVAALVDTVIRLRRASQADLAERAGIHPSNLSKFLSGETDIRISSLEKILETLEISLEDVLESEVEKLIGRKKESKSVGQAIEYLLKEADPISAKTFIDSLSSRMKTKQKKEITAALDVVNDFKSKIKTVRRN
ncbi:MAG: helix-turn-helix domain-containing protein [Bdellovibrionia bacterium]